MNAIIQEFQKELTEEERGLFEANARLAQRKPGQHLKAILFGAARAAAPAVESTTSPARPARKRPARRAPARKRPRVKGGQP
jgi:hypothetical protein